MPHLTDCGLPGVKEIPYGAHMCHFYESRAKLAAAVVPYFDAGLRRREQCVWVIAQPLNAALAQAELEKAGLDAAAVRDGALVIRDFSHWQVKTEHLQASAIVERWHAEEQRALAEGYSGLRIAGNVGLVSAEDWAWLMEYEAAIHRALQGRRIVALCTYQLDRHGPTEILDVVRRHHCTLDHPDQGWQLLPPP